MNQPFQGVPGQQQNPPGSQPPPPVGGAPVVTGGYGQAPPVGQPWPSAYPPPPAGPGVPPPADGGAPKRKQGLLKKVIFGALAIVVVIAVKFAIGFVIGGAAQEVTAPETPATKVGNCMAPDLSTDASQLKEVPCDDPAATVKIVHILPGKISEVPDCPSGTDSVLTSMFSTRFGGERENGQLCVRNLRGEHPGDPGNGGGLWTVGDCLDLKSDQLTELKCAAGLSKITALVKTEAECPAETKQRVPLQPLVGREYSVICAKPHR